MNPREAQEILNIAGEAAAALHRDVVSLKTMIMSTEEQIANFSEARHRLKDVRTAVLMHYQEHGMDAEEFILTTGNALVPLGKVISRLMAFRDCLRLSLAQAKAAVRSSNRFANKLPAIPKE